MKATDKEELTKKIELAVAQLYEHCDAVQILVSVNEYGVTSCLKRGAGNWYARQGMAHEFINYDIAQQNAVEIAEALKKDE